MATWPPDAGSSLHSTIEADISSKHKSEYSTSESAIFGNEEENQSCAPEMSILTSDGSDDPSPPKLSVTVTAGTELATPALCSLNPHQESDSVIKHCTDSDRELSECMPFQNDCVAEIGDNDNKVIGNSCQGTSLNCNEGLDSQEEERKSNANQIKEQGIDEENHTNDCYEKDNVDNSKIDNINEGRNNEDSHETDSSESFLERKTTNVKNDNYKLDGIDIGETSKMDAVHEVSELGSYDPSDNPDSPQQKERMECVEERCESDQLDMSMDDVWTEASIKEVVDNCGRPTTEEKDEQNIRNSKECSQRNDVQETLKEREFSLSSSKKLVSNATRGNVSTLEFRGCLPNSQTLTPSDSDANLKFSVLTSTEEKKKAVQENSGPYQREENLNDNPVFESEEAYRNSENTPEGGLKNLALMLVERDHTYCMRESERRLDTNLDAESVLNQSEMEDKTQKEKSDSEEVADAEMPVIAFGALRKNLKEVECRCRSHPAVFSLPPEILTLAQLTKKRRSSRLSGASEIENEMLEDVIRKHKMKKKAKSLHEPRSGESDGPNLNDLAHGSFSSNNQVKIKRTTGEQGQRSRPLRKHLDALKSKSKVGRPPKKSKVGRPPKKSKVGRPKKAFPQKSKPRFLPMKLRVSVRQRRSRSLRSHTTLPETRTLKLRSMAHRCEETKELTTDKVNETRSTSSSRTDSLPLDDRSQSWNIKDASLKSLHVPGPELEINLKNYSHPQQLESKQKVSRSPNKAFPQRCETSFLTKNTDKLNETSGASSSRTDSLPLDDRSPSVEVDLNIKDASLKSLPVPRPDINAKHPQTFKGKNLVQKKTKQQDLQVKHKSKGQGDIRSPGKSQLVKAKSPKVGLKRFRDKSDSYDVSQRSKKSKDFFASPVERRSSGKLPHYSNVALLLENKPPSSSKESNRKRQSSYESNSFSGKGGYESESTLSNDESSDDFSDGSPEIEIDVDVYPESDAEAAPEPIPLKDTRWRRHEGKMPRKLPISQCYRPNPSSEPVAVFHYNSKETMFHRCSEMHQCCQFYAAASAVTKVDSSTQWEDPTTLGDNVESEQQSTPLNCSFRDSDWFMLNSSPIGSLRKVQDMATNSEVGVSGSNSGIYGAESKESSCGTPCNTSGGINPCNTNTSGGINPCNTNTSGGINPCNTNTSGGINPCNTNTSGGIHPLKPGMTSVPKSKGSKSKLKDTMAKRTARKGEALPNTKNMSEDHMVFKTASDLRNSSATEMGNTSESNVSPAAFIPVKKFQPFHDNNLDTASSSSAVPYGLLFKNASSVTNPQPLIVLSEQNMLQPNLQDREISNSRSSASSIPVSGDARLSRNGVTQLRYAATINSSAELSASSSSVKKANMNQPRTQSLLNTGTLHNQLNTTLRTNSSLLTNCTSLLTNCATAPNSNCAESQTSKTKIIFSVPKTGFTLDDLVKLGVYPDISVQNLRTVDNNGSVAFGPQEQVLSSGRLDNNNVNIAPVQRRDLNIPLFLTPSSSTSVQHVKGGAVLNRTTVSSDGVANISVSVSDSISNVSSFHLKSKSQSDKVSSLDMDESGQVIRKQLLFKDGFLWKMEIQNGSYVWKKISNENYELIPSQSTGKINLVRKGNSTSLLNVMKNSPSQSQSVTVMSGDGKAYSNSGLDKGADHTKSADYVTHLQNFLEAMVDEASAKLESKDLELNILLKRLLEKDGIITENKKIISNLKKNLKEMKTNLGKFQGSCFSLKSTNAKLIEERDGIRRDLEGKSETLAVYEIELKTCKEMYESNIQKKDFEIAKLQEDQEGITKLLFTLDQALDKERTEKGEKNNVIFNLEKNLQEMKTNPDLCQGSCSVLKLDNARLAQELEEIRKVLEGKSKNNLQDTGTTPVLDQDDHKPESSKDGVEQRKKDTTKPKRSNDGVAKGKKKPKRPCKFCNIFQINLRRHLIRKHKNEEEVKQALCLPVKERHRAFDAIKKEGIFIENQQLKKSNSCLIRERIQGNKRLLVQDNESRRKRRAPGSIQNVNLPQRSSSSRKDNLVRSERKNRRLNRSTRRPEKSFRRLSRCSRRNELKTTSCNGPRFIVAKVGSF